MLNENFIDIILKIITIFKTDDTFNIYKSTLLKNSNGQYKYRPLL
jgi:hypothetical protein